MAREINLQIDEGRCAICRRCLAASACKVRALMRPEGDEPPYLDISRCYDCRVCIPACPHGAVSVGRSPGGMTQ